LTLLNEIMGAGNPTSQPTSLEALLGIEQNPATMGSQQMYGDPSQFPANGQMVQQQASREMPGSAFHSFNQQWDAHFGIGGAATDPTQQQFLYHQQQQQQQQQMFQQQMQHPQWPMQQTPAHGNYQAPPSYNAVALNENAGVAGMNATGQMANDSEGASKKDLSAWYGMFAELDPLANPDAIGKSGNDDDDRNC